MKQQYTLATSEFCGPCKMVKASLDSQKISYTLKNMSEDFLYFKERRIKSVPVLLDSSDAVIATGADAILRFFKTNS